jgi:hypothetical protein
MTIEDYYGRDEETESEFDTRIPWRGGLAAGFIATLATSPFIFLTDPSMLSETIAGIYGLEGILAVGLIAHLIHGTIFGLIFAVILSDPGIVYISNNLAKTVAAGLVFGFALAIAGTGFFVPAWTQFIGLANPPEMPWITPTLLTWHAIFGAVLGLLFPFLEEF